MNIFSAIVLSGSLTALAGIFLLRFAWGMRLRSRPLLAMAWGLLLASLVLGAWAYGAWGLSVVSLAAMGGAFVLLAQAAISSPRGKGSPSERRANILPDSGEELFIGRRILTFVLTVPLSMAVAMLMAMAARTITGWLNWHDANGNVLALFLLPICWTFLVFGLLMMSRRRSQATLLIVPGMLCAGIFWLGSTI